MITQILNFGMPSPIDIEIDGANVRDNRVVANQILDEVRRVPGVVDARIQQRFDYPDFDIDVDRTKAQQNGLTERDVAGSLLETLSGSFQTAPMFFLNWKNGVNYQVAAQAPQYDIQSLQDIRNIPITGSSGSRAILADVATISRSQEMATVDHYNIRRVVDVYAMRGGPRPRRGGAGHHAHRRGQPRPAVARQFRDHTRPTRDHAALNISLAGVGLLDFTRRSADRCELPVLA